MAAADLPAAMSEVLASCRVSFASRSTPKESGDPKVACEFLLTAKLCGRGPRSHAGLASRFGTHHLLDFLFAAGGCA